MSLTGSVAFLRKWALWPLLLASAYWGLNVLKPLHVDDVAYYYYARQISEQPLNPYDFEVLWYDEPMPANYVMAPPLLPYTWALALRLVGDHPPRIKLLLLPWSILLVVGLLTLTRRFAPGWELALTAFALFSPALLPSSNLMLDIPALALSLCAIAAFWRACDTNQAALAVLSGLLVGLAIETKYTGLTALGLIVLFGLLGRRWRLTAAVVLMAAQVFACWEFLVALGYGRSHFFFQLWESDGPPPPRGLLESLCAMLVDKAKIVPVFFSLVGSVTAPLLLLGLAALGVRRRWLAVVAGTQLLVFAAIACDCGWSRLGLKLRLSEILFFILGVAYIAVLVLVARRLRSRVNAPLTKQTLTAFLLLWLGMELAGYLEMTPFPAIRRILGLLVVATLLTGRLLTLGSLTPRLRRTVAFILGGGGILGLAFFALDLRDAQAEKAAANSAADWIAADGGGRVWYTGHFGFQYYAEQRGMLPLYVGAGRVQAGDYLVIPDLPHNQEDVALDCQNLTEAHVVVETDWLPLRTVQNFYGGTAGVDYRDRPRMQVRIYRVLAAFDPQPKPMPSE